MLSNGAAGSRILITTASFASHETSPIASDFTMTAIPASYLAAGRLAYLNPAFQSGGILWSVSWGGASYTGPNTGTTTMTRTAISRRHSREYCRQLDGCASIYWPGLRDEHKQRGGLCAHDRCCDLYKQRGRFHFVDCRDADTPPPPPCPPFYVSIPPQLGGGAPALFYGAFFFGGGAPGGVLFPGGGPFLAQFGVPNALANPQLELHDITNIIGMNDDWQTTQIGGVITADQVAEIQNSGLAPRDPLESAIIATLGPGSYTAIVQGISGGTGVGIVEVYDLDATSGSFLANIATRGFVQTADNAMIGGFIVVTQPTRVIIRAIGPSLSQFGVPDALANPQLELHDISSLIAGNDDWQTTQLGGIITSDQVAEIQKSQLAPTNAAESAIIATLAPGSYTAIVRGVNNTTGNALVEVYALH